MSEAAKAKAEESKAKAEAAKAEEAKAEQAKAKAEPAKAKPAAPQKAGKKDTGKLARGKRIPPLRFRSPVPADSYREPGETLEARLLALEPDADSAASDKLRDSAIRGEPEAPAPRSRRAGPKKPAADGAGRPGIRITPSIPARGGVGVPISEDTVVEAAPAGSTVGVGEKDEGVTEEAKPAIKPLEMDEEVTEVWEPPTTPARPMGKDKEVTVEADTKQWRPPVTPAGEDEEVTVDWDPATTPAGKDERVPEKAITEEAKPVAIPASSVIVDEPASKEEEPVSARPGSRSTSPRAVSSSSSCWNRSRSPNRRKHLRSRKGRSVRRIARGSDRGPDCLSPVHGPVHGPAERLVRGARDADPAAGKPPTPSSLDRRKAFQWPFFVHQVSIACRFVNPATTVEHFIGWKFHLDGVRAGTGQHQHAALVPAVQNPRRIADDGLIAFKPLFFRKPPQSGVGRGDHGVTEVIQGFRQPQHE